MARNIALVGCGAIARQFYLQGLARVKKESDQIWFVDPRDAALDAASSVLSANTARSLSQIEAPLHYVIVATPNSSHFSVAQEALSRNAHVLIEKPFVSWPNEGRQLVKTAAACERVIAINQTRRFFPIARDLQQRCGGFGKLRSIIHLEGGTMDWPFESGAAFARNAQRTGVIMDLGVHIIDFFQFLFQPNWTFVRAKHDGFQGPEGLAEIELEANEAPVFLRLSRYQRQENVTRLFFEHANVVITIYDWNTYSIEEPSGAMHLVRTPPVSRYDLFSDKVLLNFFAAGEGREPAICDAVSSLPVIDILDQIYRFAGRYPIEVGTV